MKKKKIIHVLFSGNVSGAENIAMKLISETSGHVNSYYLSPSGRINDVLKEKQINHLIWDLSIFQFIVYLWKIKPDVIHAHDFKASLLCGFFVWKSRMISHLHQNPPWLEYWNYKSILYFIVAFRYKAIVIVSNWEMGKQNVLSRLNSKVNVINNIIDFNEVEKKSSEYLIQSSYDLIFLGRLSPEKDPLRFLQIIENVSLAYPSVSVAVVGDGSLMNECEDFVNNKLSHVKIDFYGYQSNPYPILKKSKAIVITSKWEGFGLVALEAAILNVKIIAASCGGLINIVNSNCGYLCKTNTEFTDAILHVLANDEIINFECIKSLKSFGDKAKWRDNFLALWYN